MTRLESQTLIENRLGQRTGLGTRIQGELRSAQRFFERRSFLPWFLRTSAVFVSSETQMIMPDGFLREVDDEGLFSIIKENKQCFLDKVDYAFIASQDGMTGPGQPKFYTIENDSNQANPVVNFWPPPDQAYVWRMVYNKTEPELLADSSENKWLIHAPDLITAKAGLDISKALRAPEATQLFGSDYIIAQRDLGYADAAQRMAGQAMVMGG
jgi:hypothetical protein